MIVLVVQPQQQQQQMKLSRILISRYNNNAIRRNLWTSIQPRRHEPLSVMRHRWQSSTTTSTTTTAIHDHGNSSSSSTSNNNDSEHTLSTIIPIDFDSAAKIIGNESQILTIQLQPQQLLRAEAGNMIYMTNHVQMTTTTGRGGITQGMTRLMTGQSFFLTDYTYTGPPQTMGTVALGTPFPSKILRIPFADYTIRKLICQKGALLCSSHTIDVQMEFTKSFTSGFFGGEGFILQGLVGEGDVFVKAGGTLIRRELKSGEQLRISSGCLVCFTEGIDYDVQMIQGGITNIIGSGEGLFLTTLTGPGIVWLQGQPPDRMMSEIARRVPSGGGMILPIPMGGGGSSGGGGSTGGESSN